MKNFKKISFLALTFGWIGLIITHIIWSNFRYDDASGGDVGVILFWSSLFHLIFYGLFILIPRKLIIKLSEKLNVILFSIISGIYSLLGFVILIGWLFLQSDFSGVFLDALVCGIIFGFSFHTMWTKKRTDFKQIHLIPILITPFVFLLIYLFAFPKLLPSIAYKFVPKNIQHDILINTIPKFKVGDKLTDLQSALPGEFEFVNCYGNRGAILNEFQYVIEVNCCKIVRIEYGPRQEKGYSMGGEKKPCG